MNQSARLLLLFRRIVPFLWVSIEHLITRCGEKNRIKYTDCSVAHTWIIVIIARAKNSMCSFRVTFCLLNDRKRNYISYSCYEWYGRYFWFFFFTKDHGCNLQSKHQVVVPNLTVNTRGNNKYNQTKKKFKLGKYKY